MTELEALARDICEAHGVEPGALVFDYPAAVTPDGRYYTPRHEDHREAWEKYAVDVSGLLSWVLESFEKTGRDYSEFYEWANGLLKGADVPIEPEPAQSPSQPVPWRDRYGLSGPGTAVGLKPR